MSQRNNQINSSWVLDYIKKTSRPCTTLELANVCGVSRKNINPILYRMQEQGLLRKVRESPPCWMTNDIASKRTGMGRGRGRGRRSPTPTSVSQPGYNFSTTQTKPSFQFPVSGTRSGHTSPARSSPTSSMSSSRSPPIAAAAGASGRGNDLRGKLLGMMRQNGRPQTALELAKSVGLRTRKEVNPDLYRMEKEGLVVMETNGGPPKWSLPKQQHIPVAPVQGQSSSIGSISIQSVEDVMQMEDDGDQLGEEMDVDQADEEESPFTQFHAIVSHIPEENIRDRVLAVMEATPTEQRTDLELAKCIGDNYTRSKVRPFLEQLAKEGRVTKSPGFPPKWTISQTTPPAAAPVASQQPNPGTPVSPQAIVSSSPQKIGTGMGLSVTADVTDMNRNPVSVLSEFCQANKMELVFAELREFGPPHRKHFVIAAQFGGESYEAESTNKKEAKRMAADLALQSLKLRQVDVFPTSKPVVSSPVQPGAGPLQADSFFDQIAKLSHDFYNQVQCTIDAPQPGRKVIAAFVLEDPNTQNLSVVSMGSGTRCITGDHMSLDGLVVNDSHAEVVARRSLVRFFYSQLMEYFCNTNSANNNTIFIASQQSQNKVQVKDELKFHLYISTAPCGDGAQFSRGDELNRDPPNDTTHHPTMSTKVQGVLRTKMEGGEGTIPIGDETRPQTWDGIMQGGRLRTMSCSDKVGRWNVVGLQGSLLTHFMEPVYMSSLTLGSLHHHGHLSRAVCCRFTELGSLNALPGNFQVNHPLLGRVQGGDDMKRHTEKTSQFSLNWALGDERGELNDGGNGRPVLPSSIPKSQQATMCSRIAKARLFELFLKLVQATGRGDLSTLKSYKEAKESAQEFQTAKLALCKFCESKGYGVWMKKPVEEEQFDGSVLDRLNNTN